MPSLRSEGKPTPSQMIAQAMSTKAVTSGKVTATDTAELVYQAIESGQFYIYSHPHALGNVQQRMEAIVMGKNPPDPFAARPEVGEQLRQALRAAD